MLLTYAFSTSPAPLAVTAGGAPAGGVINLGVFNGGDTVYCSQFRVGVPVGPDATDLCEATPDAGVNTDRWAISDLSLLHGDEFGLDPDDLYATFTFQARDTSDHLIDYSLVLGLDVIVNAVPGTFSYAVEETSGTDPNDLTAKQAAYPMDKQSPTFWLDNLMATTTDQPTVPRATFANGQAIRLSWQSTGTWFQLFMAGQATPVYAGPQTFYVLPGGLTDSATFVLVAAVTGDPSGDSPTSAYRTIYLYDALTVTITNPDITPHSVASPGDVSGATVTTARVNAPDANTTLVLGAPVEVTGTANLDKTLNVVGTTTLRDTVTAYVDANVNGKATVSDLVVTGTVANMAATVRTFGSPFQLTLTGGAGSWTVATDGVVVGTLSPQGGGSGVLTAGTSAGISVAATASSSPQISGSFTLPVRRGDRITANLSGSGSYQLTWLPFGSGVPSSGAKAADVADEDGG
jgi:hypothetical protein